MQNTENYGLKKYEIADKWHVTDQNDNMDAIDALLAIRPTFTTANITLYVDTATGSDSNNGLTAGTAFKTISKALNVIPQIVNHTVTINVAAGTYNETVTPKGFSGSGTINLIGDNVLSTTRSILNLYAVSNSIKITATGFCGTSITAHAFAASLSTAVLFDKCKVTAETTAYDGFSAS